MKLDVPSDLDMVGDAVELVASHVPPGTLSPRRISFNLRTALAEALGNAIRYGNGEHPDRVVRIRDPLGGHCGALPLCKPAALTPAQQRATVPPRPPLLAHSPHRDHAIQR